MVGRERGLEAPVALADAQVVLLVVVAEVVEVEVQRLRDTVGRTGEGVFFSDEVNRAKHGNLDVADEDIVSKQRRAARRARSLAG